MAISGSIIDQEGKNLIQATFAESKDLNSNFQVIEQHYDTSYTSLSLSDYNENTDKVLIFGSGLLKSPSTYTIDSSGKVTFSSNPSSSSFDIIIYRSLQTEVFQGNFGVEDLINLKSITQQLPDGVAEVNVAMCLLSREDPSKALLILDDSIGLPILSQPSTKIFYKLDLKKKIIEALDITLDSTSVYGPFYKEGNYYISSDTVYKDDYGFLTSKNIWGPYTLTFPNVGGFEKESTSGLVVTDGPLNYVTCIMRRFGGIFGNYYDDGFIALGDPDGQWEIVYDDSHLLEGIQFESLEYLDENTYLLTNDINSTSGGSLTIFNIEKTSSKWRVSSCSTLETADLEKILFSDSTTSSFGVEGWGSLHQNKRKQGNHFFHNFTNESSNQFITISNDITIKNIEDFKENFVYIRDQYYSRYNLNNGSFIGLLPLKLSDDNYIFIEDNSPSNADIKPVVKSSKDGKNFTKITVDLSKFINSVVGTSYEEPGKLSRLYSWDCYGPTFILCGGRNTTGEITVIYGIHEN